MKNKEDMKNKKKQSEVVYFVKIGGANGTSNAMRFNGKNNPNGYISNGWEAEFCLKGTKISGANSQVLRNNISNTIYEKTYQGTYNPQTRDVNITVTFSSGYVLIYTGKLAGEGQITTFKYDNVKGSGKNITGDYGYNSGVTSYRTN